MESVRLMGQAPEPAREDEAQIRIREAVAAMAAARKALEALAAVRRRSRADRRYWADLQADSAALARLVGLHEASLKAQVVWA